MVCRIIGLHPATSPGEEAKITVNYYLRRRDVTNRNLADHRIVFATFMVGTVPLSHVRSRCRVMYRDFLEDPEGTKRLDDCFIFFQVGATADRDAPSAPLSPPNGAAEVVRVARILSRARRRRS